MGYIDQRLLTKYTKCTLTKYTKNTGPVFFCILGRLPSVHSSKIPGESIAAFSQSLAPNESLWRADGTTCCTLRQAQLSSKEID